MALEHGASCLEFYVVAETELSVEPYAHLSDPTPLVPVVPLGRVTHSLLVMALLRSLVSSARSVGVSFRRVALRIGLASPPPHHTIYG